MFGNILKNTFRNLYQEKLYSSLNLVGLSLSFCCFILLFLYLHNELTVDHQIQDHERIYRLVSDVDVGTQHTRHAKVGDMVGPLLTQDYEQFSSYVRIRPSIEGAAAILLTEKVSKQWTGGLYQADNSIFEVFQHDVLAGDPATALSEPRTLAISESTAKLYFGDEDPIDKTIGINAMDNHFTVKLVFADLPANRSLKYDILIHYREKPLAENPADNYEDGIVQFRDYTYFKLPASWNVEEFPAIADAFFERYVRAGAQQMFPGQNAHLELKLQALDDIYFSEALQEDVPKGNRLMVVALSVIAFFILGVATVNYMTLSTARFAQRARDTGVRKTLGAGTATLVLQFLTEGLVFSLLALLIGASLSELLLSTALDRMYLGMELSLFSAGYLPLMQIALVAVVIGLISGAYPAFYFCSLRPVEIFRPLMKVSGFGISLRSVLVGLQMLVSISVISSALIMYAQVKYMNNRPLGFDKENKLDINVNVTRNSSEFRTLLNELRAHPGVHDATMTDVLNGNQPYSQPYVVRSDAGDEISMQGFGYIVDEHYLDTFDIPLLSGRNFAENNLGSDDIEQYPLLVNEALVKAAGWSQPLGQQIQMPANDGVGVVIGVIADFNYNSLHEEVKPFALDRFYENYRWQRHFILDIDPTQLPEILGHAEKVMKTASPDMPLQYSFLDQTLKNLYSNERRQMQLIMAGSVVCIIISLLGILGMTTFTLDQASKEIAIRRVLGGTMTRIIAVKFRGLFVLITVAAVLASFLVFYQLGVWLDSFAYRVSINWSLFVLSALIVCLLVALTIMLQAIRAARTKPVQALKYE